jgi:hypothetical protein
MKQKQTSIEIYTRKVFAKFGMELRVKALLIGIRVPEILDVHPVCVEPEQGEWNLPTGILETILWQILLWASEDLNTKEPDRFSNVNVDVTSLLRQAAIELCSIIRRAVTDPKYYDIFNAVNEISSLRYEGGETRGEIVFAPVNSPSLQQQVTFLQPVPLTSHRHARKIV